MSEGVRCSICRKWTQDYCATLTCRDCHKTESLEDCLNNVQVNDIAKRMGLPARPQS